MAGHIKNLEAENAEYLRILSQDDVTKKDTDALFQLAEKGVSVNIQNDVGTTFLILMVVYGQFKDVVSLIDNYGADVNLQSKTGNSATHFSALFLRKDVLIKLIDAGADTSLLNQNGHDALAIAKEEGYQGLVELIESHIDKKECRASSEREGGMSHQFGLKY